MSMKLREAVVRSMPEDKLREFATWFVQKNTADNYNDSGYNVGNAAIDHKLSELMQEED